MTRSARWMLVLALLPGGLFCARAPRPGPEPPPRIVADAAPEGASVVIVLNDTMRRDRVGAYGGPAQTPNFDRFARESLLVTHAYSQAPWTKPSIATLFTGLYPSQHGVASHPGLPTRAGAPLGRPIEHTDVLSPAFTTLAEALRGSGFRTAAFVSNPWMDRRFGFEQGFELYDDSFGRWGYPGTAVTEAGLGWLRALPRGERFFLYLHYLDSHRPYGALGLMETALRSEEFTADPRPLPERGREELADILRFEDDTPLAALGVRPSRALLDAAYDRGIANFDRALGMLLDGLAAHSTWPRTVVIVTSDHGEALYQRGYGNHGTGLYDDEIAIPMAIRLPERRAQGERVSGMVGLVDIMPTLCRYLTVTCPTELAGAALAGQPVPVRNRYLFAEGVGGRPRHRSIRNANFKLIYEPEGPAGGPRSNPYALFDLSNDPRESRDVLSEPRQRDRTQPVFASLDAGLREHTALASARPPTLAPVDTELAERLRALGYVR